MKLRDVHVAGVGMTDFGRHPDRGLRELGEEAVQAALTDAALPPDTIEAAWCGNAIGGVLGGQLAAIGHVVLRSFGVAGIPITRVENACASGSTAFREAYLSVATGQADVALAVGVEHMTAWPTAQVIDAMAGASDAEVEAPLGLTFPGVFGMVARRHMADHGTTREQLAAVAVKNHRHGSLNERAQFGVPITVEDVLRAPAVATPLGRLDCCPVSDGAAAALLVSAEVAAEGPRVAASALTSGGSNGATLTSFAPTRAAAAQCFDQSGLGPADVDLAEVHDCFTVAEVVHYEDLGFCRTGEGGELAESGATALGGGIPVNTSGGLKAKGHPLGATGIAQVVEIVEQLRGDCGERQVDGAEVGLTHCIGGFLGGDGAACAVHVLTQN